MNLLDNFFNFVLLVANTWGGVVADESETTESSTVTATSSSVTESEFGNYLNKINAKNNNCSPIFSAIFSTVNYKVVCV